MIKIIAYSSIGGHSVQLLKLDKILRKFDTIYITSYLTEEQKKLIDSKRFKYSLKDFSRNSNLLNFFWCLFSLYSILKKENPDFIITTGAAPGVLAIILGKLLRKKTIWIDSIANSEKLSLSAKIVLPFSNIVLTQWEHLQVKNKVFFWGKII